MEKDCARIYKVKGNSYRLCSKHPCLNNKSVVIFCGEDYIVVRGATIDDNDVRTPFNLSGGAKGVAFSTVYSMPTSQELQIDMEDSDEDIMYVDF